VAVRGARGQPAVGVGGSAAGDGGDRGRAAVDRVGGDPDVVGRGLPGEGDRGRSGRGRGEGGRSGGRAGVRGAAVDVHAGSGGVAGQVPRCHLVGVSCPGGGRLVGVAGHVRPDGRQVGPVAVHVVGADPDVVGGRGPGQDVLGGAGTRGEAARRRG